MGPPARSRTPDPTASLRPGRSGGGGGRGSGLSVGAASGPVGEPKIGNPERALGQGAPRDPAARLRAPPAVAGGDAIRSVSDASGVRGGFGSPVDRSIGNRAGTPGGCRRSPPAIGPEGTVARRTVAISIRRVPSTGPRRRPVARTGGRSIGRSARGRARNRSTGSPCTIGRRSPGGRRTRPGYGTPGPAISSGSRSGPRFAP